MKTELKSDVRLFVAFCLTYIIVWQVVYDMIAPFFDIPTTLQSMMNAKLSLHRFWPCHENGLFETIQMIPHNLYVSFKSASLYYGLG